MSQSDYTEHIARISMGKDSLKMLDVIISRGLPLDKVTTTDVWATDTVRAELPEVLAAKERIEEKLWQMYRINVEHLCARNKDGSKKTYEQMFYHIPNRRSQDVQVERERDGARPLRPDSIQGFPVFGVPWCQSTLKRNSKPQIAGDDYRVPSQHRIQLLPEAQDCPRQRSRDGHLRTENSLGVKSSRSEQSQFFSQCPAARGRKRNIVEYLGIAADEPDRFGQLSEKKRAPLVEFGIEEPLCGLFCQYNDMLLPSYETSCRDGCWFCHNQGVDQLRNLWKNYPDHWALLMKWDMDSPVTFKADGHTVHDFDRRFQMEVERKIPMDRSFRWAMLDKPPAFVADRGEQILIPGFRR